MRIGVLQFATFGLIISSSAAHSFTREEILKNPNAVANYLASYADKGYTCKSKNFEESYINVIKFSTNIKKFPYLSTSNSVSPKLDSVTAAKGINTLIVAHEFGTEIASLSGQSLIGKSDDTDSYIAAGYFKDLEYYPKYNKSDLSGINFDRQTLYKEGEAFVTGLVINKNDGSMKARVYQNQADPGQRPQYKVDDNEYNCTEISGNLDQFTSENVVTLINDMKATEKRIREFNEVQQKKREEEENILRQQRQVEAEKEDAIIAAKTDKAKEAVYTAEKIMSNPSGYAESRLDSVSFSLRCVDAFNNTYKIVAFKDNMNNYPLLRYTHNEKTLVDEKKLSIDNIRVKTSIEGYNSNIPSFEDINAVGFILKFDKNIAGDTFSAGQYLVGNIQQTEDKYLGLNIEQLRDGNYMPDLLRARNKKQEITQTNVSFGQFTIDRETLETVIQMDIEGKHQQEYKFSCQLSEAPKEDAKELLTGGVDAIKQEQARLGKHAKSEAKNRI